jgi:hypothetical protein
MLLATVFIRRTLHSLKEKSKAEKEKKATSVNYADGTDNRTEFCYLFQFCSFSTGHSSPGAEIRKLI